MKSKVLSVTVTVLALGMTAACGGGSGASSDALTSTGPIKVWLSNNPEEIAWGEQMVEEWNADHPDEEITAQEIPAGKTSEEVIGAAITAGNAPCLVFNTSPVAVPQFQKQGGLVALDEFDGATSYIEERSGASAEQYQSPDGSYYQIPWKQNPVMVFYNKDIFKKAGLDPENPKLGSYDDFLATSKTIVDKGAADAAIWPAPSSEFFQSWFDFYPLFAAATGGQQLVEDGKATFDGPEGIEVADFWAQMYSEGYAPNETYNGDSFADGKAAMAIVGPWAIAVVRRQRQLGCRPRSRPRTAPAPRRSSPSRRQEHRPLLRLQEPGTAWDVLEFATAEEQDGQLLEMTGQMPIRAGPGGTYPDYFEEQPGVHRRSPTRPRAPSRCPTCRTPSRSGRSSATSTPRAVIFGKTSVEDAMTGAADEGHRARRSVLS